MLETRRIWADMIEVQCCIKYFKKHFKYKYKYSPVKVFKILVENTVLQKYLKY